MTLSDRAWLRHRALQELSMTLAANNQPAEDAHNELTGLYLRACAGCTDGRTPECRGCPLAFVCRLEQRSDLLRAA